MEKLIGRLGNLFLSHKSFSILKGFRTAEVVPCALFFQKISIHLQVDGFNLPKKISIFVLFLMKILFGKTVLWLVMSAFVW